VHSGMQICRMYVPESLGDRVSPQTWSGGHIAPQVPSILKGSHFSLRGWERWKGVWCPLSNTGGFSVKLFMIWLLLIT